MSEERLLITDSKAPDVSPRIHMNDPNFDKLTSVEKLNDSNYCSEIDYTFPSHEPLCGYKKYTNRSKVDARDRPGNFLACQSDCMNKFCNSRMQRSITRNGDNANDDKVVDYRENRINKIHNGSRCCEKRMRGGGCGDIYRRREKQNDPRIQNQIKNECAYRSIDNFESPNYYYSTRSDKKENYQENVHQNLCTMKPCTGVDCLIRAFEQTKEFVDSLGIVPGLAGLGLADSMENSYFQMKERLEDFEEIPVAKFTELQHHHPLQVHEKFPKIIETKPFTLPSSGRRESMNRPVLSCDYSLFIGEKKSKASLSEGFAPCGQTCCRSRRKITVAPDYLNENTKLSKSKVGSKKIHKNKKLSKHKSRNAIASADENEKLSRRKIHWVYSAGDSYPGVFFGHKNCNNPRSRVPANMGWLWNDGKIIGRLKPRIGWRPGKISRTLKEIIKEIRAGALEDSRSRSAHSRGTRSVKSRSQTSLKKTQLKKLDEEDDTEPPPTLHILRRDGTYYVTMYPVKQEAMDVPKLLEPMKPLQFKIFKDKDNRSEMSSSTASDIEIEFSPPAAVNRYRKKPDVVHIDTQVKQQEILDAFKPAAEKKEKKGQKGKK